MEKTRKRENLIPTSRPCSSSSLQTHSIGISKIVNEPPEQKNTQRCIKESQKHIIKDEAQKGQKNGKKDQERPRSKFSHGSYGPWA